MSTLHPIKLMPAREQVASALRKAILSKEFAPGESLTLDGISSRLQVSSTPVREALQMLASEGLIQLRPNKEAIVLGVDEKTIRDHYQIRAILESEAVAALCRKNVNLDQVKELYNRAKNISADEQFDYSSLNQAFHFSIWEATGNTKLVAILSSLWNGLSIGRRITMEEYALLSLQEHEAILDRLISRDEQGARKAMHDHIIRSRNDILTWFSKDE